MMSGTASPASPASPLTKELRYRRPDLVQGPFVGDQEWVKARLWTCGLSPPD